jgi:O-antigen ligase
MRKFAFILSLILIFTIPWEDAFSIVGVSSITRYIGIVTSIIWLISALLRKKIRKPHIFHLFVLLFILWNITSLLWTLAVDESTQQVKTYLQLFVFMYIMWDLYLTLKAVNSALQVFVLGCYVLIITTVINYSLGREIGLYSGGRFAGVGNANDLALILTLGLPVAWHLATSSDNQNKNKILRMLNFSYIPGALFAILLTGTRTALFAVIPAFVYILGTVQRLKPILRFSSLIVFIGAMFWLEPLIPRSIIERLGTTGASIMTGDLGGRVNLWLQSLSLFYIHPIIGVGGGVLSSNYVMGALAHNTFLSVLTEVGLIGFLLFLCILVVIFQQAYIQSKDRAKFWFTILGIWTIGVFTLTWENKKVTWLLFSLIVVGANIVESQVVQLNQKYPINRLKPKFSPSNH